MHWLNFSVFFSCCCFLFDFHRCEEVKSCRIASFYDDIYEDQKNQETKLTVNVYDCSNTLIPAKEKCTLLRKDWVLEKGKTKDLNFTLYDYETEVKFFGRTQCVAVRLD